jgi:hypothetical protein
MEKSGWRVSYLGPGTDDGKCRKSRGCFVPCAFETHLQPKDAVYILILKGREAMEGPMELLNGADEQSFPFCEYDANARVR